MDAILPSQPSSYKQIIKSSFRLYGLSISHCILLSLALSIMIFIPRFIFVIIGEDLFRGMPIFSMQRLWIIAINLFCLTFFIGIIWRMNCVLLGKHEPIIEDIGVGIKKLIYVVLAVIIQSSIVLAVYMIGMSVQLLLSKHHLLLSGDLYGTIIAFVYFTGQFILILYISTLFIFLMPLIAVENKGVIGALIRSISLVWNHWWRVFSVQITPWIIYTLILLVIRYALNIDIHIYFSEVVEKSLWPAIMHAIIFAIYIPLSAATLLVQLKDLELRKKIMT